jgi:hypothetical protein
MRAEKDEKKKRKKKKKLRENEILLAEARKKITIMFK